MNPQGSRKRKRGISSKGSGTRDWGRGNATASVNLRTDIGRDHVGHIPDVDVGQTWCFRRQVAASGVHRPPVSGMHSKGTTCYSIVASHGYEDDADTGEELLYTGAGGRDLSGNKRTNEQSMDQEWDKSNLALAHACAVKFNKEGGDAGDKWRKGAPIRVVRGSKDKKASGRQAKLAAKNRDKLTKDAAQIDFQPTIPDIEGVKQVFRYDGIYKVVRYWREKGSSGFLVCRYLLRRDDPVPAPWTEEGKALIKAKGLSLQLPDDSYHCTGSYKIPEETLKLIEADTLNAAMWKEVVTEATKGKTVFVEKVRAEFICSYCLDVSFQLIEADSLNAAMWKEVVTEATKGKTVFVEKVRAEFICSYCLDPMREPVSLECSGRHLLCRTCVKKTLKSMGHVKCESCKGDKLPLDDASDIQIYEPLKKALAAII